MNTVTTGTDTLPASFDSTAAALVQLLESHSETDINTIPFTGSWTAAQVAIHVTKSNLSVAHALAAPGKPTDRDPAARIPEFAEIFLDYEKKFQSPEFIRPTQDTYAKDSMLADLKATVAEIGELISSVNLSESIDHPAFGPVTKLELAHFSMYHTQRHTDQAKNILAVIANK